MIGKKKTFIEIDYHDVDELAERVYGHNPEIVASEGWNNDEEHSMMIDGKLDKWDEESLLKFQETGRAGFGITGVLLNDLARRGEIEVGEYLVNVCW